MRILLLLLLFGIDSNVAAAPLTGKVACVTGASRGIGRGIAIALAQAGATVYITARSANGDMTEASLGGTLESVAQEITLQGGRAHCIRCDHRVDSDVQAVFERIAASEGRLDLLVNNAFMMPRDPAQRGQPDPDLLFRNFWEQPPWFWDDLHSVGLRSHYVAAHFAFPLLRRTRSDNGSHPMIVHISSFGGVSYSFNVAYGAGKAGVDKLAKDMAVELRSQGISSIALYPGIVRTERMNSILSGGEWRQRTGLAAIDACIESPIFSGRVIAALFSEEQREPLKRTGNIVVAAEAAKELGVTDVGGGRPPSLRSLRFLLPAVLLGRMGDSYSPAVEELLVRFTPDWVLPMQIMAQGPPAE